MGEEPFTSHEQLRSSLLRDGAYKSLDVGIEMGTVRGQAHQFYATVFPERVECLRVLGITIVEPVPCAQPKALHRIRSLPSPWWHEGRRRLRRDANDLDPLDRQLHDHENITDHQTTPGSNFRRAEIRGGEEL